MYRYRRGSALLSAVLLVLTVAMAAPAAAAESDCAVWADQPTTDTAYVYSTAHTNCIYVPFVNAVKVRASVQEKVLSVWTVRASAYNYGNTDYLTKLASYNCNGHGKDVYKSRSTGWDSSEKTKTRYSSELELTC